MDKFSIKHTFYERECILLFHFALERKLHSTGIFYNKQLYMSKIIRFILLRARSIVKLKPHNVIPLRSMVDTQSAI